MLRRHMWPMNWFTKEKEIDLASQYDREIDTKIYGLTATEVQYREVERDLMMKKQRVAHEAAARGSPLYSGGVASMISATPGAHIPTPIGGSMGMPGMDSRKTGQRVSIPNTHYIDKECTGLNRMELIEAAGWIVDRLKVIDGDEEENEDD